MTAISLILAIHGDADFQIERRLPSSAELEDASVWIVDVGGLYEPEKFNFELQQPQDYPASFVMVAGHLGPLNALSVLPWWRFKDSVYRIGHVKSSQIFQAGDARVNRNPVEQWFMNKFALEQQSSLPMLKSFGAHISENARSLKQQIDFRKTICRLVTKGVKVAIGETYESCELEEFRRLEEDPPDIIISPDRRSAGWRLFRYDGTPVDFSLISNCPEIEFAHQSGFLVKTKRVPFDELVTSVSQAIIHH